jgi:predicted CXXCH cytochrome family protein
LLLLGIFADYPINKCAYLIIGDLQMYTKRLLAILVGVIGLSAGAGTIIGSAHDFSGQAWSPNAQSCVACHAPHVAAVIADAPLWNHASSVATYTVYTSSTMNATVGQPGPTSKLCLSCHDGSIAVNSFGGVTGTTLLTGGANIGTVLTNDHPIGFTYDAALVTADGALAPITNTVIIGSGTKIKSGPTVTIASAMLYAGKMECASCHDVHNTFTAATGKLVKVSMASSALCTTCHTK